MDLRRRFHKAVLLGWSLVHLALLGWSLQRAVHIAAHSSCLRIPARISASFATPVGPASKMTSSSVGGMPGQPQTHHNVNKLSENEQTNVGGLDQRVRNGEDMHNVEKDMHAVLAPAALTWGLGHGQKLSPASLCAHVIESVSDEPDAWEVVDTDDVCVERSWTTRNDLGEENRRGDSLSWNVECLCQVLHHGVHRVALVRCLVIMTGLCV